MTAVLREFSPALQLFEGVSLLNYFQLDSTPEIKVLFMLSVTSQSLKLHKRNGTSISPGAVTNQV